MPGIIPCSSIVYTAMHPTPRRWAISGTAIRLFATIALILLRLIFDQYRRELTVRVAITAIRGSLHGLVPAFGWHNWIRVPFLIVRPFGIQGYGIALYSVGLKNRPA